MSLFSCRKWKVMRNFSLVLSFDSEFFMECGITKLVMSIKLDDKSTASSALCLHYAVLGSRAELEQLKRELQNTKLRTLKDKHACTSSRSFSFIPRIPSQQTLFRMFVADYSDRGSISRVKKGNHDAGIGRCLYKILLQVVQFKLKC